MILKKAVKRLQWRFANFKTFNVNNTDKEALNSWTEWTNSSQENRWENNQVAAKLYINELMEQQKRYGCSVFDNIPQKQINQFLEKPLGWHIERFTDYLNMKEMEAVKQKIESTGLENLTPEEAENYYKELKGAANTFSMEEVEVNLLQIVTEALRKFS